MEESKQLLPSSVAKQSLLQKTWQESKQIWRVAFPALLSRLSSYGLLVVTQAFIGHISEIDLAAYALVQAISLQFGNGFLIGISSATETLCGQAFGARKYNMLGIYLQRSWLINLTVTTILLPLFIFATPIFRLLGQDTDIADAAERIALWFIPFFYQNAINFNIWTFLQAQLKNKVVAWCAVFSFVLHVFLSWLFVSKLDLGTTGAMVALNISAWLWVSGQLVYIFGGWCSDTWTGFSMAVFSDLWPAVKLSLSSGIMLCLELWYNAILVLIAGYLEDAEIAISAFSICINVITWQFMIGLGVMGAAIVRVANELGKGDPEAIKFSIKVVLSKSVSIGVFFWILCMVFGRSIAYLFTSNEDIVQAVASLSYFLAFSMFLNSIQPILSGFLGLMAVVFCITLAGIAIGSGRQGIVAYINLATYYIIGLPLGLVLGYVVNLGIEGIWTGMICGVAAQTLAIAFITWRTNWDTEVRNALERMRRWSVKPADAENETINTE